LCHDALGLADDDHRIRPKIRGSLRQFLVHRRFQRQHATQAEMMQFNVAARLSGAAQHSGPKNNPAVLQLIVDAVFPGCLVRDVGV
jgi:hypothetical protein